MVSPRFNNPWPWLRGDSQEDLPGVRVGSDVSDPIPPSMSFGLSNWQPPNYLQLRPWLETEAGSPSFWAGADTAHSRTPSPSYGLSNWRPPESIQQPIGGNADASQGLSNWRPPPSAEQPSIGFRTDGSIDDSRVGNIRPFDTREPVLGGDPLLETEQRPESQSWWSEISRPWLRADSGHERQALDAAREVQTSEFNPLSFTASPVAPWPALDDAASDAAAPLSNATTTPNDLRPVGAGVVAATANAATAGGASGTQMVGEALSKLAGLAGRVAPTAAGAASAVAGAVPLLLIPTNTQSETIVWKMACEPASGRDSARSKLNGE
jgi:hypothetical protein